MMLSTPSHCAGAAGASQQQFASLSGSRPARHARTHKLPVVHEAAELAVYAQGVELAQREARARRPLGPPAAGVKRMAQVMRHAVRALQQQHHLAGRRRGGHAWAQKVQPRTLASTVLYSTRVQSRAALICPILL